jgi:hypothetical protein
MLGTARRPYNRAVTLCARRLWAAANNGMARRRASCRPGHAAAGAVYSSAVTVAPSRLSRTQLFGGTGCQGPVEGSSGSEAMTLPRSPSLT